MAWVEAILYSLGWIRQSMALVCSPLPGRIFTETSTYIFTYRKTIFNLYFINILHLYIHKHIFSLIFSSFNLNSTISDSPPPLQLYTLAHSRVKISCIHHFRYKQNSQPASQPDIKGKYKTYFSITPSKFIHFK